MNFFPSFRIRAEKVQTETAKIRHVNARMLLALGFKEFLGLYEYPLDGRGIVRTRQYVSYNPETDNMIVWNFSRYHVTENPTMDQIKKAISPIP